MAWAARAGGDEAGASWLQARPNGWAAAPEASARATATAITIGTAERERNERTATAIPPSGTAERIVGAIDRPPAAPVPDVPNETIREVRSRLLWERGRHAAVPDPMGHPGRGLRPDG